MKGGRDEMGSESRGIEASCAPAYVRDVYSMSKLMSVIADVFHWSFTCQRCSVMAGVGWVDPKKSNSSAARLVQVHISLRGIK